MIDIRRIIESGGIHVLFQPIISVKAKSLIGYESLARGIDPDTGDTIPPAALFAAAESQHAVLDLDRACRRAALSAFAPLHRMNCRLMLFLNFESSIIDMGTVGSGSLISSTREAGVHPDNVVIEVIESKVSDIGAMRFFVESHRAEGFLIALDDVGAGHSNLDRIPLVRPDIIKIDRSIISGIDREYFNRRIMEALRILSRGTGSLILAEGVETEDEAVVSYEAGADLYQGYFFSPPASPQAVHGDFSKSIEAIAAACRTRAIESMELRRKKDADFICDIKALASMLSVSDADQWILIMTAGLARLNGCECLYMLDNEGRQAGPTVCSADMQRGVMRSPMLFHPAEDGTDHSQKEYFYLLKNLHAEMFTTAPYISLATGSVCRTVSLIVRLHNGERILCADFQSSE